MIRALTLAVLLSAALQASAKPQERVVWADVISVEPVVQRNVAEPTHPVCFEPKPASSEGLAAMLAWDLGAPCLVERTEKTQFYRVRYAWDGREYEHAMDARPGGKIGLLLEVDVAADN